MRKIFDFNVITTSYSLVYIVEGWTLETIKMIDIDFSEKNGTVVFDDFNISENTSLSEQAYELKEDMLQITFPNWSILDVGWRPSFEINGSFKLLLIKDYNWDNPIYSDSLSSVSELKKSIEIAISKI